MDKRFSVRLFGRRFVWTVWCSLQRCGGGRRFVGMTRPGFVSVAIILGGWRLALATWARAPRCYTRRTAALLVLAMLASPATAAEPTLLEQAVRKAERVASQPATIVEVEERRKARCQRGYMAMATAVAGGGLAMTWAPTGWRKPSDGWRRTTTVMMVGAAAAMVVRASAC